MDMDWCGQEVGEAKGLGRLNGSRQASTAQSGLRQVVGELLKTISGDKGLVTLIHIIIKITPYYKELVGVFGSQANGKYTL
ncbi:hypothetical protein BG015_003450, partial [Linnemannia schmuckeri]